MNLQKGDADLNKLRKPVIITNTAVYLKCYLCVEDDLATSISNKIGAGFTFDEAFREASEKNCYDSFIEVREICLFIETEIQTKCKLHFPLLPPMSFPYQGNYWQVRSIEYDRHPESGILIATLKTYLV